MLGVSFANNQWVLDRCREYQADPYGHLDLWARGHYKSTIITFAGTIYEVINNPEITIGIFSHKLPIARAFVIQIKNALENNELLKALFPEIFYKDPKKESPKWTEDKICVKRTGTRKEMTVEACGVVEGQPTGMHFDRLVYDDLVTLESVNTPEQILKTTAAYRMSLNLGSKTAKRIMIGTFYAYNDTYNEIIKEGSVKPRIYPAMTDPTDFNTSVFLSPDELKQKRVEMGAATFGTQMLLDPSIANNRYFLPEWLKYYNGQGWEEMNRYIIVDPASSKDKKSDSQFHKALLTLFGLTLQMRNSKSGTEEDYIISPVSDKKGNFYDSRNGVADLPIDADANGAYNIARKGLMIIDRIKAVNDEDIRRANLLIKNKEWLEYVQSINK